MAENQNASVEIVATLANNLSAPQLLHGLVTPDGIFNAFRREQGADISELYERGNIAIDDYESSLKRDTSLIRGSKGTPRKVNIFGYLFNIDTEQLTLIVEDRTA